MHAFLALFCCLFQSFCYINPETTDSLIAWCNVRLWTVEENQIDANKPETNALRWAIFIATNDSSLLLSKHGDSSLPPSPTWGQCVGSQHFRCAPKFCCSHVQLQTPMYLGSTCHIHRNEKLVDFGSAYRVLQVAGCDLCVHVWQKSVKMINAHCSTYDISQHRCKNLLTENSMWRGKSRETMQLLEICSKKKHSSLQLF